MAELDHFVSEEIPLFEWIHEHPSEEELQSMFLNMDRALKYIHDHDYCIEVFHPSEINVLNNEDDYIQFKKIVPLPNDISLKKEYIREDIFHSAFIQIAVYSNSMKYLTPDFLKENFDEFVQFLPSGDVPYYRGVVQRGASVYFCEYSLERRNRELVELEKELGENTGEADEISKQDVDITNDKINDRIYPQLVNRLGDTAFAHWLIIPGVVLGVLLLIGILSCFLRIFF